MATSKAVVSSGRTTNRNVPNWSVTIVNSLPSRIRCWLVDDMKCQHFASTVESVLPSTDSLQKLCRGQKCDIWEFIISRVKHADRVKVIRGNLLLNKKKSTSESPMSDLKKQRQLQQSLLEVQTTVNQSDKTLPFLQNKILERADDLREKQERLRESKRKIDLLENITRHSQDNVIHYKSLVQNMKMLFDKLQTRKEIYSKIQENAMDTVQVKNNCRDDVEILCCALESLLKTSQNKDSDFENELVWSLASELISSYSIHGIIDDIVKLSDSAIEQLRNDNDQINMVLDAETLQFQYESNTGELVDVSKPREALQSVAEILEKGLIKQFDTYVNSKKTRNDNFQLELQISHYVDKVNETLSERIPNCKPTFQVARLLIQNSLNLTSKQAALNYLIRKQDALNQELKQTRKTFEEKEEKLKQMENFSQNKKEKQKMIRNVIKQVLFSYQELNNYKQEIEHYVKDNLTAKCKVLLQTISSLENCTEKQLKILKILPLKNLPILLGRNWTVSPAFSVYCLESLGKSANSKEKPNLISQLVKELNLPVYKNIEALAEELMKRKFCFSNLTSKMQMKVNDGVVCKRSCDKFVSIKELHDLAVQIHQADHRHKGAVIFKLHEAKQMINEGLQLCKSVSKEMECWWNQPAKNIPTTITVDSLSLQQWLDRWTTASALATQLSLKHILP